MVISVLGRKSIDPQSLLKPELTVAISRLKVIFGVLVIMVKIVIYVTGRRKQYFSAEVRSLLFETQAISVNISSQCNIYYFYFRRHKK